MVLTLAIVTKLDSEEHEGKILYVFYAHLHKYYVVQGKKVLANDIITASGKSGNAKKLNINDDHLHFEIRQKLWPGYGLKNRISPIALYNRCPIAKIITG